MSAAVLPVLFSLFLCPQGGFCPKKTTRPALKNKGTFVGRFQLTYYWLTQEKHRSHRDTPLVFANKKVVYVSRSFAKDLRMQGSGFLRNGKIVQYLGSCFQQGTDTTKLCLQVRYVNQDLFPMGVGAAGVPLLPFRSLAVDTRFIPLGTPLYIPALQKLMKQRGMKHDGCFIADDRGGKIKGRHLDLFVGTKSLYHSYLRWIPKKVSVLLGNSECMRKFQVKKSY